MFLGSIRDKCIILINFTLKASSVAKWITEGAKPEKIVIGIPAYGRTFELTFPDKMNNPGSPINGE